MNLFLMMDEAGPREAASLMRFLSDVRSNSDVFTICTEFIFTELVLLDPALHAE